MFLGALNARKDKAQRLLVFLCHSLKRSILSLPQHALIQLVLLLKARSSLSHPGMKLVDISVGTPHESQFILETEEVLHLIATLDPRRYRRVMREIRTVANQNSLDGNLAEYGRLGRICWLDFSIMLDCCPMDREERLRFYACCVVHEATHGRLFSKRIPYTRRTYSRVERLCTREAIRFARRFAENAQSWHELLWANVETGAWDDRWTKSYFQRLKSRIRNLKKLIRRIRP